MTHQCHTNATTDEEGEQCKESKIIFSLSVPDIQSYKSVRLKGISWYRSEISKLVYMWFWMWKLREIMAKNKANCIMHHFMSKSCTSFILVHNSTDNTLRSRSWHNSACLEKAVCHFSSFLSSPWTLNGFSYGEIWVILWTLLEKYLLWSLCDTCTNLAFCCSTVLHAVCTENLLCLLPNLKTKSKKKKNPQLYFTWYCRTSLLHWPEFASFPCIWKEIIVS